MCIYKQLACKSLAVFQSGSIKTTQLAPVKLIPSAQFVVCFFFYIRNTNIAVRVHVISGRYLFRVNPARHGQV